MSKLNIYVSPELRTQLDLYKLDMSKICQEALWAEIQKLVDQKCGTTTDGKPCTKKARWMVLTPGYEPDFACNTHALSYCDVVSTLRRLDPAAPKLAEAQA